MKIVFTVSPSACTAAALAVFGATTAQLPPIHGTVGSAVMMMAGIACGRLINSGPGTPAA
jgi:hypothetical protein